MTYLTVKDLFKISDTLKKLPVPVEETKLDIENFYTDEKNHLFLKTDENVTIVEFTENKRTETSVSFFILPFEKIIEFSELFSIKFPSFGIFIKGKYIRSFNSLVEAQEWFIKNGKSNNPEVYPITDVKSQEKISEKLKRWVNKCSELTLPSRNLLIFYTGIVTGFLIGKMV